MDTWLKPAEVIQSVANVEWADTKRRNVQTRKLYACDARVITQHGTETAPKEPKKAIELQL